MRTELQRCNTIAAPGNGATASGVSSDYEGVAIQQVGGRLLRTVIID